MSVTDRVAADAEQTGASGGVTMSVGPNEFMYASDISHRLVMILAGRAAEEVILGRPSSGSGGSVDSDLAAATGLATTAATSFGLDPTVGLIWLGLPDVATLAQTLSASPSLAARVREVVDDASSQALSLIGRRVTAVEALAAALLDKRALDGQEATSIAADHPGPEMEASL